MQDHARLHLRDKRPQRLASVKHFWEFVNQILACWSTMVTHGRRPISGMLLKNQGALAALERAMQKQEKQAQLEQNTRQLEAKLGDVIQHLEQTLQDKTQRIKDLEKSAEVMKAEFERALSEGLLRQLQGLDEAKSEDEAQRSADNRALRLQVQQLEEDMQLLRNEREGLLRQVRELEEANSRESETTTRLPRQVRELEEARRSDLLIRSPKIAELQSEIENWKLEASMNLREARLFDCQ